MGKREDDLTEHMIRNQIEPQIEAARLKEDGVEGVDVAFVDTSQDAKGWTVTCTGCGRTAKLAFDPGKRVGLCPDCIRAAKRG